MTAEPILVIVPARGGSKGVPQKNVRLLDGAPLITYALQIGMAIEGAVVIVSTDSDEIARIAGGMGAEVMKRPEELSGDAVALDEVIQHCWAEFERQTGVRCSAVVTIQPTSPLLKLESVIAGISTVQQGGADSVISVTDARHLYWIDDDTGRRQLFPRVNRQWLPPLWREAGAFVVCTRSQLTTGTRIGGRIHLQPLDSEEGIDIDSSLDWALAEFVLRSPRVVIRVRGNAQVGLGHAYRVLSLSRRLVVPSLTVVVDGDSQPAADVIDRENFRTERCESDEQFLEIVSRLKATLVINDILDTSDAYMRSLRDLGSCAIVNLEDLGLGANLAHLTINALFDHASPNARIVGGWKYADLRDEFVHAVPRPLDQPGSSILISYGGTDPSRLTERAIKACAEAADALASYSLHVIVGSGNTRSSEIMKLLDVLAPRLRSVELHTGTTRMADLMRDAEFALTSNGRTVYELASMQVPMITISQNMRESGHTFAKVCGGAIDLGIAPLVDAAGIREAIERLATLPDYRRSMRERLSMYDLRQGMDLLTSHILTAYQTWREETRGIAY